MRTTPCRCAIVCGVSSFPAARACTVDLSMSTCAGTPGRLVCRRASHPRRGSPRTPRGSSPRTRAAPDERERVVRALSTGERDGAGARGATNRSTTSGDPNRRPRVRRGGGTERRAHIRSASEGPGPACAYLSKISSSAKNITCHRARATWQLSCPPPGSRSSPACPAVSPSSRRAGYCVAAPRRVAAGALSRNRSTTDFRTPSTTTRSSRSGCPISAARCAARRGRGPAPMRSPRGRARRPVPHRRERTDAPGPVHLVGSRAKKPSLPRP